MVLSKFSKYIWYEFIRPSKELSSSKLPDQIIKVLSFIKAWHTSNKQKIT